MIWNLGLFLIVLFSQINEYSLAYASDPDDELIGVAVLYRHGDRGPIGSYPNDPYHDITYWPNGFGQLLDKGKLRLFTLGKWLRSRYRSFLPEKYNYQDIYVKSTDVDRTLMSAASNLAGLYYPTNQSTMWQENLAWDPIPIHTEPESNDAILSMSKNCPNFKKLYNTTLYSEHFQNVLEEHKIIKAFVEEHTGWNITDVTTFQGLYTVLYVYRMHNISYWPEWAFEMSFEELSFLAGVSFSTETYSTDLQRFKVGPFFDYLHTYFNGIINGTNPRFLMFSAHDGTIAGILNTYETYDYHPPEFGEIIIWEIYKNVNSEYYLKFFLKRNDKDLEQLQIKDCEQNCSYNQYLSLLKNISVDLDTWELECNQEIY